MAPSSRWLRRVTKGARGDPGHDYYRELTMFDTAEKHSFPTTELTIVPCPQRDAWAVVNRRGDTLAVGEYGECLRHMRRLTATAA